MFSPRTILDNQLIRLYRLAHRQQENYTTESFAHLLLYLVAREREIAVGLRDWLTHSTFFSELDAGAPISLWTQVHTEEHGIPDVHIEANDLDVIIEVKLDGSLTPPQVVAYLTHLDLRGRPKRRLVGLTGSTPEAKMPEEVVLQTWGAVGVQLREVARASHSDLTRHLVDQFVGLLNHLQLLPLQVRSGLSGELLDHRHWASAHHEQPSIFKERIRSIDRLKDMKHVDPLRNLLLQMDSVVGRARGVNHHSLDSGPKMQEPWIGYNVNDMAYFFYVSLAEPENIYLQRYGRGIDPKSFDGSYGELQQESSRMTRWRARLDLLDPALAFFSSTEVEQQQHLDAFFERAFAFGEALRPAPDATSRPSPARPVKW